MMTICINYSYRFIIFYLIQFIGTCPFGVAHVDTPKGDLNLDGKISGPDVTVIENHYVYPFGKQQFSM